MLLRRAVKKDWPAISRISGISGYNDYINRWGPSYMDDGIVIIAEEEGPAAFSRIDVLPDGASWLSGLRVDPEHRRKGIGMALTEKAVEVSEELGAYAARMLIEDSNSASREIAERSGFKELGHFVFLKGSPDLDGYSDTDYNEDTYIADGWRFFVAGRMREKTGRFSSKGRNIVYSSDKGGYHHILSAAEHIDGSGEGMTIMSADTDRSILSGFTTLDDFPAGIVYEKLLKQE